MLNPYSHRYSNRYKVKQYFIYDAKKDAKKVGVLVAEGLTFTLMFAMLLLVPALFH